MRSQIEKAIRETLVIQNRQSLNIAVEKIIELLHKPDYNDSVAFAQYLHQEEWMPFRNPNRWYRVNRASEIFATTDELYDMFKSQPKT